MGIGAGNGGHKSVEKPLLILLPQIDLFTCKYIPDDNLTITKLTFSKIRDIRNIKEFSCSAYKLKRQVKTYFSKYRSIFLYELFTNLLKMNFRLQIILDLLKEIITSKSIMPYLFYSLKMIKKVDISNKNNIHRSNENE